MNRAIWLRFSLLPLIAAMQWGCSSGMTPASIPPWYESPAGLTAATGATVSKSDNQTGGKVPDGDTRVVTVDGQQVDPSQWDKVILPGGLHTLGVMYNGTGAAATVPMQVNVRPGKTYEAKAVRTGPCDAEVWLQGHDSNETPSAHIETHLTAKPSAYGSSAFAVACN
ncbi:MAG TPA: hypothetical protein VL993_07065 [Stellaceae bacterium]|nr:hypothetical protein [Stellaceae bacterium]